MLGIDQITAHHIDDSNLGTAQTLEHMAALVRRDRACPILRKKALEIVSHCGGHNFDCEIKALFQFVRDQIVYRRDPFQVEWVQDAKRTIFVFGSGDCDCKCVCLGTLLACLGHNVRFKVLGLRAHSYRHVYLEIETRDGWKPLDPTPEESAPGWEARGIAATYEIFSDDKPLSPLCLVGAGLIVWGIYELMRK